MDLPPPPLPPKAKSNDRLVIMACSILAAIVVCCVAAGGFFFVRQQQAKRAAMRAMEKTLSEERNKAADTIKNGTSQDRAATLNRLKDQLDKSASQLNGADAAGMHAMATYLGKVQVQFRAYNTAMESFQKAKILTFQVPDRATIETNRKIVHDFLASNAQLENTMAHAEPMLRAELEAAKVPPAYITSTLTGFNRSQAAIQPLQSQMRKCDKALGETALEIYDLLDKNWGRWDRNESSGHLRFQDDATLNAFNTLIKKIQVASAEEQQVQEKLVAHSKAAAAAQAQKAQQ